MQKIKVLLFTMVIMLITATFFESISMAAQVTRIHSSRKYIFVNGSIADGFVLGARVCFYSSSGEEITCGRIEQASESFARVRVDNRIAKKIRYGMEARLSFEKADKDKKEAIEPPECTNDSECGSTGFCVNGRCRQIQEEETEYRACTDDSECGDTGFCFNGRCQQR